MAWDFFGKIMSKAKTILQVMRKSFQRTDFGGGAVHFGEWGSPQPPTQEVSTGILKEVSEKGHTTGVIEEDTYQTGHRAVESPSESPCTHFPYPHAFKMEAEYSTRERLPQKIPTSHKKDLYRLAVLSGIWRILTQPQKEGAAIEIKGEEQEKGGGSIRVSKRLKAAVWAKSSPCFEKILGGSQRSDRASLPSCSPPLLSGLRLHHPLL